MRLVKWCKVCPFHNRFALSLTSCLSAKVSLDRMTEFLQKTELLDSFAEKLSQTADIPTTTGSEEEIGFKNATFSWYGESSDYDTTPTPSQRTFRLHISGEILFKRDCINLIIGPTWVFNILVIPHNDFKILIISSGSGKTSILMALLGVFGSCFANTITVNMIPNI